MSSDASLPVKGPSQSWLSCAVALITIGLQAAFHLVFLPGFVEVYEDFEAELPWLLKLAIQSNTLILIGLAPASAVLIIKQFLLGPRVSLVVNWAYVGLAIIAYIGLAILLVMPLMTILQDLN